MLSTIVPHHDVLDRKLRTRIIIYLLISVVLLAVSLYEVASGDIQWWFAVIAVLVGLAVGYVYGRTRKVEWNEAGEKIVSRIDQLGMIIIALYILFSFGREWLFSHWFSGVALSALSFSFAGGILFGRFLGTRFSIKKAFALKNT